MCREAIGTIATLLIDVLPFLPHDRSQAAWDRWLNLDLDLLAGLCGCHARNIPAWND
jgi:hypothetical protein